MTESMEQLFARLEEPTYEIKRFTPTNAQELEEWSEHLEWVRAEGEMYNRSTTTYAKVGETFIKNLRTGEVANVEALFKMHRTHHKDVEYDHENHDD